jgi:hypothetical protein
MKRDILKRLERLEQATGTARQVLIAGATERECATRWAAWCAAHPGEVSAALFVVTGVPRAALGVLQ